MHSKIILFAPLIFVPLSVSACRAERLDATTQMSGATTNVAPQFKEVSGALTWKTGKSPFCSGSWISPNVFLTAAHCLVTDSGKRNGYEREALVTGYVKHAEGLYSSETYEIADVIPPPSYPEKSDGVAGDALDLALVRTLGRKVTVYADLPTSASEFL
jgi:V8-like Glu-specific endopeptidase